MHHLRLHQSRLNDLEPASRCMWMLVKKNIVSHYSTYDDQDYLTRSIVPTDHFQKSLPRLPVPKLENTCKRYLDAQRPILNDEQFKQTERIVNDFAAKDGKALHKELVAMDKSNKNTSYISAPWSDMYLKGRMSIVLNHNPFMSFTDHPVAEYNDQIIRATNFVVSSLRFMKTLKSNVLEPEVFHLNPEESDTLDFRRFVRMLPKALSWYGAYWYKAFPLDMSQYSRLFNGCRIPRPVKDELFTDPSGKHLLVIRKGHFYTVDVLDKNDNILPAEQIMAHLQHIKSGGAKSVAEFPIGVLTTQDRDTWMSLREQLVAAGNSDQLRMIQSALFALALDESRLDDSVELCKEFLHADGINRWFDKCFTLIINERGKACVNFEHSWGDGVAVLRYFNDIYNDSVNRPVVHPTTKLAPVDSASAVSELVFNVPTSVQTGIRKAQEDFNKLTTSLGLNFIQYAKYGKDFIKEQKLSPDSILQLAIQMAYFKQYGKTAATYESASTAAFKHGRTETVRSATMATKQTCLLFEKSDSSKSDRLAALVECSKVHSQLTKEAAMGQGFDRHLFALRYLAESKGIMPDLFLDPAYKMINHVILSTSTLTSPAVRVGGFGPVVPDGYGIGYSVDDEGMGCIMTGYNPSSNVDEFLECIGTSLDDIYDVLM